MQSNEETRAPAQPIPIWEGTYLARQYGYEQVVILARRTGEGGCEHVTTAGTGGEHCEVAAKMGNALKRLIGWPEMLCHATPARAKAGPGQQVIVPRAAIERAIEVLEQDGDEHGVALNLFAMLAAAPDAGDA